MKLKLLATGSKITLLFLALMHSTSSTPVIAAQSIPRNNGNHAVSKPNAGSFTIEQTLSDQAQRTTIAFD